MKAIFFWASFVRSYFDRNHVKVVAMSQKLKTQHLENKHVEKKKKKLSSKNHPRKEDQPQRKEPPSN